MTVSAGLGIANFVFDDVPGFWRWVALCDEGGVDSLWQSDRLISREPMLECMALMGALAGATKRLKFGMNVASLGWRDPVLTAKQCATIDVLSEGRLLPAFGVGSMLSKDFAATHTDTKRRGRRTDEALEIMAKLWTQERVDFAGKCFTLEAATISPRPVQNPLPLWVGGSSEAAIQRTARFGTGWQAGIETAEQIAPVIAAIKQHTAAHGRAIDEDHFGAGFAYRFGSKDEPTSRRYVEALTARLGREADGYFAIGDADTVMERLNEFRNAGVHKFVLRPIAFGTDDTIRQTERLITEVLPRVAALNPRKRVTAS
jgi:probable F420-dependent oxidoreductase